MSDRGDLARRFERARRHSVRVRFLRVALPVVVVTLVATTALAVWLLPLKALSRLPAVSGKIVVSGSKITMQAPRMTGFTRDNRAYEMTAEAAAQDLLAPTVLELTGITGKLEMRNRGSVDVRAAAGTYDTKTDILKLTERIVVEFATAGYQGHLTEAVLDTKKGHLVSHKPVEVLMSNGSINAQRLEIVDSGALVRFDGGVVMDLVPAAPGTPSKAVR